MTVVRRETESLHEGGSRAVLLLTKRRRRYELRGRREEEKEEEEYSLGPTSNGRSASSGLLPIRTT